MSAPPFYEYSAIELPSQNKVKVKMCNLSLHSSGVFSNVYKGTLIEPAPEKLVAIKKTWPESGQDAHKNYEILMLMELGKERHNNIIQVLFTFKTKAPDGRTCESMVFDFMPATLHQHIKSLGGMNPNIVDIKLYTWQIFNGLYFLSRKKICHRDIKPQNILIDPQSGRLKIADLGSAKVISNVESTAYQVTRFYRPPELLLDATFYSCLVDIWSAGCVLGELLRGYVLFPGRDAKHQLRLIIDVLGSPDKAEQLAMRAVTRLEGTPIGPRGFSHLLPHCPRESIDFLQKILVYIPKHRLHGLNLLTDTYFNELFVPNKKRSNGQLISDTPSFKDMIEFGPKHPRRNKKVKSSLSAESVCKTVASAESVNPGVTKTSMSKEPIKKGSNEGVKKSLSREVMK